MYTIAILLSSLVGVALGLLGGGGSILTVPILIYGLGVEKKTAIASSLIVVGLTAAAALIQHSRQSNVEWRTGLIFAGAGMLGAFGGGMVAGYIPANILLLMFAFMMVATALAMFRGRREPAGGVIAPDKLPVMKVVAEGIVVGVVTGLVGAGGGFLVVPALVLLGGLPMKRAIGTSLLVISLKSFAGFAGHAAHVSIDWNLTLVVSGAAIIGSFVGGTLAGIIAPEKLRRGFAGFVMIMAIFMVYKEVT